MSWSPDGQRLASASWVNTVKIFDARTGQDLLTLINGSTIGVVVDYSVSWSPDGQRLASASEDNTLKVWDARTGQELLTLKGHRLRVTSVSWSPDGKRIVSSSGEGHVAMPPGFGGGMDNPNPVGGEVKLWDARTGQDLLTLNGHTMGVTSVSWSPDGQRLASASDDKTLKVWDARTGQDLLTLKGHTLGVTRVSWSPDGKRIASSCAETVLGQPAGGEVKLWEALTAQELLILKGHTSVVTGVAWSRDGQRVVANDQADVRKSWNPDTGKEIVPCVDEFPAEGGGRDLSPDGQRQAFVQHDRVYVGPRRLRVDELARQQEENPALTYLWHLRMAREARQQGDDRALFFHLRPLLLSFFTQLDARSQAFDPTWAQWPPLSRGPPNEDPDLLGVSAAHLQRLREELDREVAVPPAGWEAWAARAWCRHVQGDAAGAAADLDSALHRRPQEPALLSLRICLLWQARQLEEAERSRAKLAACPGVDIAVWDAWQANFCEEAYWAEAVWHLDHLLAKPGAGAGALYVRRGLAKLYLGQQKEAAADWARAVEQPQVNDRAWSRHARGCLLAVIRPAIKRPVLPCNLVSERRLSGPCCLRLGPWPTWGLC